MPYRSPHGGSEQIEGFPIAASQTFEEGNPVSMSGGRIEESLSDPTAGSFDGVSAQSASGINLRRLPKSQGESVSVYLPVDSQLWRANNFARDGLGTAVVPDQTDIGTVCGLILAGSTWFADSGSANALFYILDVLDSRGNPIDTPNLNTGPGAVVVLRQLV